MGMWFSEDQRANIIKNICSIEIGLSPQTLIIALHIIVNIIGRAYFRDQQEYISNNNNKTR